MIHEKMCTLYSMLVYMVALLLLVLDLGVTEGMHWVTWGGLVAGFFFIVTGAWMVPFATSYIRSVDRTSCIKPSSHSVPECGYCSQVQA